MTLKRYTSIWILVEKPPHEKPNLLAVFGGELCRCRVFRFCAAQKGVTEIQRLSDLIHSMHLKYNIYKSWGAAPGHWLHTEVPVTAAWVSAKTFYFQMPASVATALWSATHWPRFSPFNQLQLLFVTCSSTATLLGCTGEIPPEAHRAAHGWKTKILVSPQAENRMFPWAWIQFNRTFLFYFCAGCEEQVFQREAAVWLHINVATFTPPDCLLPSYRSTASCQRIQTVLIDTGPRTLNINRQVLDGLLFRSQLSISDWTSVSSGKV